MTNKVSTSEPPWVAERDGVSLVVRVVPRAARTALDGVVALADGRCAMQVRLHAPPVDGAANKALAAFLAKALHVRASAVTLRSGEASRLKRLHIEGSAEALAAGLVALL